MVAHQIYALISNDLVENIIVCGNYELANMLSRASYGEGAIAQDCMQYRCMIGDKWIDGKFYRETDSGLLEVEYVPTESQEIGIIKNDMADVTEYMVELDYMSAYMSLGL